MALISSQGHVFVATELRDLDLLNDDKWLRYSFGDKTSHSNWNANF